jgi:hypothetical protein
MSAAEFACSVNDCPSEATMRITKRSPIGEIDFTVCDHHYILLAPHVRSQPLERELDT